MKCPHSTYQWSTVDTNSLQMLMDFFWYWFLQGIHQSKKIFRRDKLTNRRPKEMCLVTYTNYISLPVWMETESLKFL